MQFQSLLAAGLAVGFPAVASAQSVASQDALAGAHLTAASLQDLELPAEPGAPFDVEVRIHGGLYNLQLEPHSMRADDFQLLVQGADGSYTPVPPAPL